MHKLQFSIVINAPGEMVWDTMLDDETYRQWTAEFMPGSHYVGDWNKGSKILFLGPDGKGNMSGMVSRIKENRRHEYISIEHIGLVENGNEVTTGEAVKNWAGAHENYTFNNLDGKTELLIEMGSNDEFKQMFKNTWPKALQKLKYLAEK